MAAIITVYTTVLRTLRNASSNHARAPVT